MIEAVYSLSATLEGAPGTFTIKAQDDTLQVALSAVAIDSRLRTDRILSTAVYTPDMDEMDYLIITSLSAAFTLNNPTSLNSLSDGRKLLVSITDEGLSHGLFYGDKYVGRMKNLPSSTIAGKELLMGFMYDAVADTWNLIALSRQP